MAETRTVIGHYETPDGVNAVGRIRFIPSTTLYDADDDTVITPAPITETLVAGSFSVDLIATDDPDVNPSGWTWIASELVPDGREYAFQLPVASPATVDITDLTPVVDVDLTWAYATVAQYLELTDRMDDVESNAAVVVAAVVIHPFLVMGS